MPNSRPGRTAGAQYLKGQLPSCIKLDPAQPSSNRPICLWDTICKLFEKIILTRNLYEVSDRGLMRDEQFGFRPRHKASLQLASVVERITWNVGENRLTGAFPQHDLSLPYRLNRWPPIQTNTPKPPVLYSPYNLITPPGSEVRSVLPDRHVISSRYAGRRGSGWIDFLCPI